MARAIAMRKAKGIQIGDLVKIDSCLEESHTFTNQITDHPVENGANISDHSRPEPDRVTLRCFVSNTPLEEGASELGEIPLSNVSGASPDGRNFTWQTTAPDPSDLSRGQTAFETLDKMRNEGALITVVTELKTYDANENIGMMIESITVPVARENFDGLEFSITLKRVIVVNTRTTRVTTDRRPRQKKKLGQTAKKTESKDNRSAAAKGWDYMHSKAGGQ